MNKKMALLCILLTALLLASGCAKKAGQAVDAPTVPVTTQQPPMEQSATDVPLPEFDMTLPANYDPSSEEDPGAFAEGASVQANTVYTRAGATAIPIDPVDMPTPTPRPPLVFTYSKYTSNALGVSFESIAGYDVDESQQGAYVLREPADLVKDKCPVEISLSVSPVQSGYKADSIKGDLVAKMKDLGSVNYEKWESTSLNRRTLLGKDGYYGNYRGVMFDGTVVRGRVHMALVDGQLLTLHISCPGWYNSDYMNVYARIRNTLKKL